MASTFSTNLAIELIGTGDQAGTWGVTTNTNLGTLIEQAISGYVTQAVSTGADTTITIPNGATGVARNMYIELTGTGGTNTNLIVPSNKKLYFIFNNTSSGQVTVKVSGQTGVSVPNGKKVILVCNGTDIVNGLNYIADFGTNSFTVTNLTASSGTITNLIATTGTITTLSATSGNISNLVSSDASATVLRAGSATLTHLSATSASITNLALTSLTISSLSITNVSVASATVSSNLTLSGGTANGVLYLNGSKVATSGSALTFDGTNVDLGTVGAKLNFATTGSATRNYVGGAADGFSLEMVTQRGAIQPISYKQDYSVGHVWSLTGTGAMALTSTGLGIGTSSPGYKLEVVAPSGDNITALFRSGDATAANNAGGGFRSISSATAASRLAQVWLDADGANLSGGDYFFIQKNGNSGTADIVQFSNAAMTFATNNTTRMTLDASGNLGIGTSSPAEKLTVNGSIGLQRSGTQYWHYGVNASNALVFTRSGVADRLTLDSDGNLGIGTSSPDTKLTVAGNAKISSNSGTTFVQVEDSSTGGRLYSLISAGAGNVHSIAAGSFYLRDSTSGANRLLIDPSGNLGIGVTPSAWGAFKAVQVGSGSLASTPTGQNLSIAANAYFDGTNWKYVGSAVASEYRQNGGTHFWSIAASGTAGNNISWTQAMTLTAASELYIDSGTSGGRLTFTPTGSNNTIDSTTTGFAAFSTIRTRASAHQWLIGASTQAMTLDASGNLGVGLTSPSYRFDLETSATITSSFASTNASNTAEMLFVSAGGVGGNTRGRIIGGYEAGGSNYGGYLAFNTTSSSNVNTERARITADGQLALGTSTASSTLGRNLTINGANAGTNSGIVLQSATTERGYVYASDTQMVLGSSTSIPVLMVTGGSERARITSGGYSKFSNDGTYAGLTGTTHEFRQSAGDNHTLVVHNTAATLSGSGARGIFINYTATPNSTDRGFIACFDGNTANERATIRSNGGLANYQSNNVDLSDARTKNSITPAASMWDKIGALEIVTYKYNDQTHDDVNVGVIAQQVESVEPVWVDNDGFGETPEGEEPLKTVYTKDITFAAIKALQEAMARIEKLEAEMAALKGA